MTTLETKADAEALINKEGIEYVSVRFTDLIGVQQHFTVPASEFLKDAFDEGMPFDGSSIEGFQAINESDMKLVPDIETAFVDPFRKHKTLDVAFSIVDPLTDEPYSRDPRQVAAKAESYLKSTGIADTASFAPEAEFFIFDKVRCEDKILINKEKLVETLKNRNFDILLTLGAGDINTFIPAIIENLH